MSLPEQATDNHNPFAAPSVNQSKEIEPQQWGWQRVYALLCFGYVFQVVFTILTIQFLHSSVFGVIETPYLHLFVTIAATLFATGLLLRKCQFRSAVFASQLMNLVQWGTFIVTASVLKRLDFTSVRLSSSDKKIFFCIYLCAAAVIAIACWFFGRRRVSGTETVAE